MDSMFEKKNVIVTISIQAVMNKYWHKGWWMPRKVLLVPSCVAASLVVSLASVSAPKRKAG